MARKAPFLERMSRRGAIVSGRSRKTLTGSGPKHRSVFLHMPKCGGTSLSEAMYATVPFHERIGVIDAVSTRRAAGIVHFAKDDPWICHEDLENGQKVFDLREQMLLQHMAWDTMLIHGHVFWSERAEAHFGDSYRFVTLLRDPVERTVSNMRMAQRAGLVGDDLEAYLGSDVARRHARVFLRYLAGRNDIADGDLPEATALANRRLTQFAVVGFLDRLDAFNARYREIFGVRLAMRRLNAAPDRRPDLSETVLHRIRDLCAPDIEIYEKALERAAGGVA